MYKLLIAGAIVSTLMVIQSKAEETTQTSINPQLKEAFERAKRDLVAHKRASSMKKTNLKNLPLIPEEKQIEDFPAPMAADENDPETISHYYDEVASSYLTEADKTYQQMQRAHQAKEKHKTKTHLTDMRHQDRHLPDDISLHKANTEMSLSKSSRHTPQNINRENEVIQDKRYKELKNAHDALEMKHEFYSEIADLISPNPVHKQVHLTMPEESK